ncbi:hypothetical protein MMC25_003504 [Agyrium rufum]|nr:hypothetical protein [Agyrium rufum]
MASKSASRTLSPLSCIIAGVGPGTSASIARKFAQSYPVVLLARTPANYEPLVEEINGNGGKAVGYSVDISDEDAVKGVFGKVEGGKLAAAIYNVGGGFVRKPFLELTTKEFTGGYQSNGLGGYLFAKYSLPLLLASLESGKPSYPPSLIFTGATASVKANALVASFSTGKWALRALASSLAKEFGPKGVHVGHVIVSGFLLLLLSLPRWLR